MFVKKEDEILLKYPGDLNGKQFKLENNKRCEIYINDYNAGGFWDKCEDCIIFWAPSTGSVFIRDCINCRFVIICNQLRLRDCHNWEFMLFSNTDPILESCSNLKYWWANFSYPELQSQMNAWNLSIWNNTWADQYDFTPSSEKPNFKLVDEDGNNFIDSFKTLTHNIMLIQAQQQDPSLDISQINLNFEDENETPLIPITTGNIQKEAQSQSFILFHSSDGDTIHQIYRYFYITYFKGKRNEYWLKGKL